jgi:hypothetical protein
MTGIWGITPSNASRLNDVQYVLIIQEAVPLELLNAPQKEKPGLSGCPMICLNAISRKGGDNYTLDYGDYHHSHDSPIMMPSVIRIALLLQGEGTLDEQHMLHEWEM